MSESFLPTERALFRPVYRSTMAYKEDIQITAIDQNNINNLEDELVVSDADIHPYKVGESFFHISTDETNAKVESAKQAIKERIVTLESELAVCRSTMATLKKELYLKFGDNINLED
ncbi:Prefoldin subunit 4 [Sparganum proliferum]